MIKLQLIGEFVFSNKDLQKRNYSKSIMTDCWMKLVINDDLFFDDWICPLELYFQYLDWKEDYKNGVIRNFEYISDDNGNNPILCFKEIDNRWIAYSVLTNRSSNYITFQDVLYFFELFTLQLMQHQENK